MGASANPSGVGMGVGVGNGSVSLKFLKLAHNLHVYQCQQKTKQFCLWRKKSLYKMITREAKSDDFSEIQYLF